MNDEKAIVTYATDHGDVKLSPSIVRSYLVSGKPELVSDNEVIMFMQLCRYQGLNPFLREAYLIKYSDRDPATIVTGKDTFTKRAASIKECEGYNAGIIVQNNGNTELRKGSAILDGEKLLGGWAEVFRTGWREPLHAEVSLKEYLRTNREGQPTRSWASMPATMIRKVALVQALREAFPDRFQGMYSPEEMPVEPTKLDPKPVEDEQVFDVSPAGPEPVTSAPLEPATEHDFGAPDQEFWTAKKTNGWDAAKAYLNIQYSTYPGMEIVKWDVVKRDDGWHAIATMTPKPSAGVPDEEIKF